MFVRVDIKLNKVVKVIVKDRNGLIVQKWEKNGYLEQLMSYKR